MDQNSVEVAMAFMAAINARDVLAIHSLMHPEHRFIDAAGQVFRGRDDLRDHWAGYFQLFPDYQVECACSFANGTSVALFGDAWGTPYKNGNLQPNLSWRCPAAWLAEIRDGLVYEWRIYCDLRPQLDSLA